jgi:hypothetical protein
MVRGVGGLVRVRDKDSHRQSYRYRISDMKRLTMAVFLTFAVLAGVSYALHVCAGSPLVGSK